jgi:hypothetical protein
MVIPTLITSVGLFEFHQGMWAVPGALGWMCFVSAPFTLVWVFCFVDWDKIEPPKKEGGQTGAESVIDAGTAGENDVEERNNMAEVLSLKTNDEEENKSLLE